MSYIRVLLCCILLFLAGCSLFNDKEQQVRQEGIIDACYTVLEYSPADKDTRIEEYLEKQKKTKTITDREKSIIKDCLDRTERSPRWQKGK